MFRDRLIRKALSTWLVGVLLLTQWSVVAYACPGIGQALVQESAAAAVPAAMADCDGMSATDRHSQNSTLCKVHCDANQQAPTPTGPADVPAAVHGVFIPGPAAVGDNEGRMGAQLHAQPRTGAPPGWPPLYLTLLVLRN